MGEGVTRASNRHHLDTNSYPTTPPHLRSSGSGGGGLLVPLTDLGQSSVTTECGIYTFWVTKACAGGAWPRLEKGCFTEMWYTTLELQ